LNEPKFRIPLLKRELREIGRLSVNWGQIDHFLLQSVALLLARDLASAVVLAGDATTGPLCNLLNKSRHLIAND